MKERMASRLLPYDFEITPYPHESRKSHELVVIWVMRLLEKWV